MAFLDLLILYYYQLHSACGLAWHYFDFIIYKLLVIISLSPHHGRRILSCSTHSTAVTVSAAVKALLYSKRKLFRKKLLTYSLVGTPLYTVPTGASTSCIYPAKNTRNRRHPCSRRKHFLIFIIASVNVLWQVQISSKILYLDIIMQTGNIEKSVSR